MIAILAAEPGSSLRVRWEFRSARALGADRRTLGAGRQQGGPAEPPRPMVGRLSRGQGRHSIGRAGGTGNSSVQFKIKSVAQPSSSAGSARR